ncbi:MAG: hypothetical protein H7Y12_11235 [Sphingobacteriaceae bacterium]|nr:hypothetical protein [Cytophagaceae bacterium]
MKTLLLAALCFGTAVSASAQDRDRVFKPFKFNVALGYAKPLGGGASGGVLFALEPKYSVIEALEVGIRAEFALTARTFSYANRTGDAEIKALNSFLLTGNYVFGTGGFRPYLGAGLGLYTLAGGTVTIVDGQAPEQDVPVEAETKFGFMGRAGFKAGHFNFGLEFNAVPNSSPRVQNVTLESQNSYLGIKAGVDIGGGRYR